MPRSGSSSWSPSGSPSPLDPAHVWNRKLAGWHAAFWLFMALALARSATAGDLRPANRLVGLAAVLALSLAYAVLRPSPVSRLSARNLSYLLVAIVAAGVACGADPTMSMVLFIAYPQMWIFSSETRDGVVLTVALTMSCLLGFLTANGWSMTAFWVIGPSMAVSLAFSVLMGIWISKIIGQSRERAELIAQLEATRSELGAAHHAQGVMAERERLAREIHDTLAQGFTSVVMLAQAARVQLESGPAEPKPAAEPATGAGPAPGPGPEPGPGPASIGVSGAISRLEAIEEVARENLGEARALVAAFAPVALDGSTLTDAIRRLAARFGTETGLSVDVVVSAGNGDDLPVLSRDREVVLLRAAQEALANVRRHAQARRVSVRVSARGDDAWVEVEDDGIGFEPSAPAGFGLTGMRDRVRDAGGSLDVDTVPGHGTRVSVRVPVAVPT